MPLICTFASEQSPPTRIAKWIAHLETLQREYPDDPSTQQSVEILLEKARSWMVLTERGARNGLEPVLE